MSQGVSLKNKRSREILWMREDNGVFVLDVYVAQPDCSGPNKDFHRRGLR